VFLEDAGVLSDLGNRGFPDATLPDGKLQFVLRVRGRCRRRTQHGQADETSEQARATHFFLPQKSARCRALIFFRWAIN
jgi:hypothetical protein